MTFKMRRAAWMTALALVAAPFWAVPRWAAAQVVPPSQGLNAAPAPMAIAASAPVALVIANSAYVTLPKLPNCEQSANLVSSVLSRAGFRVIRQTNPSNARLGTAVAALGDEAGPAGRSMIYYCGYVASYADRLFVVPDEARLERDADLLSQGIVARLLMASVAGVDSQAGLVLMDVATPDGQPPHAVESMLRPADARNGGLAVAMLPAAPQGPAPLAAALPDLVAGGRLEVGAALATLKGAPGLGRALVAERIPTQAAWLLGGPPEPEAVKPVAQSVIQPVPASPPPSPPISPPPAPPPAPVASATPPPADSLAEPNGLERRRIQLGLQRLGYFKGSIDGLFGLATTEAIKRFQKEAGAEPSGRLTTKQAEQLLQ